MVSVIFEIWPNPAHHEGYLNWAAELKTDLLKMSGFISIDRCPEPATAIAVLHLRHAA